MVVMSLNIGSNPPFFSRSQPPAWVSSWSTVTFVQRLSAGAPPPGGSTFRNVCMVSVSSRSSASSICIVAMPVSGFAQLAIRKMLSGRVVG